MREKKTNNLPPFYVYGLFHPETNELFYVGKGQGRRIEDHLRDAINGNTRSDKINTLKSLLKDNNFNSIAKVIGRYRTAVEAYAVESTLIKWVYGFENITNEVHGYKHEYIRNKGCYDVLENIDIPKKVAKNTGDYTRILSGLNEQNDIEPKLISLKRLIVTNIEQDLIYRIDMSRPKDPALFIEGLKYCIQLILRSSSNDHIVLNVKPAKGQFINFENLAKKLGVKIRGSENDKYFKVPGIPKKVSIHNEDIVLEIIKKMLLL